MNRFLISTLAAGLLGMASAWAATPAGNSIPEALKDIKQASGTCLRDDAPAPGGGSSSRAGARPDLSCAIAPSELMAMLGRADTTLIDVRLQAEHEAFRIDGALNMPVSTLRTRTILQGKAVVLVGNGKAERELYAACAELKSRGFKRVKVLHGGMPSWLAQGGAVQGRAADGLQSTRLSAVEVWGESQFEANLVLVTGAQEALHGRLPYAMSVSEATPAAIKALIHRRGKELKGAPLAAVVLVTSPDTPADALQRIGEAIRPTPLLFHAEPPENFSRQIAQLQATWSAQARGPKRLGCGL